MQFDLVTDASPAGNPAPALCMLSSCQATPASSRQEQATCMEGTWGAAASDGLRKRHGGADASAAADADDAPVRARQRAALHHGAPCNVAPCLAPCYQHHGTAHCIVHHASRRATYAWLVASTERKTLPCDERRTACTMRVRRSQAWLISDTAVGPAAAHALNHKP
jgi:hypothetical protein